MGRKPRIQAEPSVVDGFLRCLELGLTIEDSCAYSGLPSSTYHDCMDRGKRAREAGKEDEYTKFSDKVEKAKAEFVRNNVAIIQKAAMTRSWQAAAWLLERRRPKDYGPSSEKASEFQAIEIVNDVPKD